MRRVRLGRYATVLAGVMAFAGCGPSANGGDDAAADSAMTADVTGSTDAGMAVDVPSTTDGFTPAAHAEFPQVPANDRLILSPMNIVPIFTSGDPLESDLTSFVNTVPTTQWWQGMASEYALGALTVAPAVNGPDPSATMSYDDIVAYLTAMVQAGTLPAPDGTQLYTLFLPPGVDLIWNGQVNTGCQYVGGYHHIYRTAGLDSFAVMQRCAATSDLTALENVTITTSHEIAEAVSDPDLVGGYTLNADPSAPWNSSVWTAIQAPSVQSEIGDLCAQTRIREAGFSFQRVWSNMAASLGGDPCFPAAQGPYYSVSTPREWYAVPAGGAVDIPVTAWSTGARDDWAVGGVKLFASPNSTFDWSLVGSRHVTFTGTSLPAGQNGETLTLHVSATRASPGDWVLFRLISTAMNSPDDLHHLQPVGVHVM